MSKKELFHAILSGEKIERPLVSCWHHFLEAEYDPTDLAQATIAFAKKYDWDWIKINPRATYLAETFGNTYDPEDYQEVFPRQVNQTIQKFSDVWTIPIVDVTNSAPLQEQLTAAKTIRAALPETPLMQTIFSPLTILMFLTGNSSYYDQKMYGSQAPLDFKQLLEKERFGVHQALLHISQTLVSYLNELETIGLDGIFYAVTGTAHPQLFSEADFREYSVPYDAIVLNAIKGKTILHTCGPFAQPQRFEDYPIAAISWDTNAKGNPDLSIDFKKIKVGGISHQIFGKNQEVELKKQIQQALDQASSFLLTPNCAVPVDVSANELTLFRKSI
ncbi:MAG: uroporphyrinogen-III decarboxylase [Enterococcus sp.]|nr:uroporphyrinogen-III decarboxylase [Enterococcus sp.]